MNRPTHSLHLTDPHLQYVQHGSAFTATITKQPVTTSVAYPPESPSAHLPTAPGNNATTPIWTGSLAPSPTVKVSPMASPFTGGSASLSTSFGSVAAAMAMFVGLLL